MTPARLAEIGRALYGPRWQSELARAVGVQYRAVRRWMTGERAIPSRLETELVELAKRRREEIDAL